MTHADEIDALLRPVSCPKFCGWHGKLGDTAIGVRSVSLSRNGQWVQGWERDWTLRCPQCQAIVCNDPSPLAARGRAGL
jgi:hypothetical protein